MITAPGGRSAGALITAVLEVLAAILPAGSPHSRHVRNNQRNSSFLICAAQRVAVVRLVASRRTAASMFRIVGSQIRSQFVCLRASAAACGVSRPGYRTLETARGLCADGFEFVSVAFPLAAALP